jgi:hypothetical protein
MIELTDDQRRAVAEAGNDPPVVVSGDTTYRLVRINGCERALVAVPLPSRVPDGIRRSRAALRRDLPELLASRRTRGKWVCYRGDERIGIGRDYASLMRECNRRSFPDGEFIIERAEVGAGNDEEEEVDCRPLGPD